MHDQNSRSLEKEHWVVWSGDFGIAATASIDRVENHRHGRHAWLERPFDMVGPFSLDELETHGQIRFAACIVMSRQRWQEDQVELRRESYTRRRSAQERIYEQNARFSQGDGRRRIQGQQLDERRYREALSLPTEGKLQPSQIKLAFRRLAQKAHPDVGGTHEQFIRLSEARNALLDNY